MIFITQPYTQLIKELSIVSESEIGLNLLLDSPDIDLPVIIGHIKQFNFNFIFSVSGNLNANDIKASLSKLYTLFTLCWYCRKNLGVVPVFVNDENNVEGLTSLITSYFKNQGEETLRFEAFPLNKCLNNANPSILCLHHKILVNANEELFDKYDNSAIRQIIVKNEIGASRELELQNVRTYLESNKYLRMLLTQAGWRLESSWLSKESGLWKQRAMLYHSFIDLSKQVGEAQYYDILDWYNREYEALPIWYKRIGHIIKYIKGKNN